MQKAGKKGGLSPKMRMGLSDPLGWGQAPPASQPFFSPLFQFLHPPFEAWGWRRASWTCCCAPKIRPHFPPSLNPTTPGRGCASTALHSAPFPYSPGDPRRGTVGARGHLGGRTERVRGSPRPGGHGGRPPQGGPSRRRPRSRAPGSGPGWGHGGGSALRRGAGRGRPGGGE